MVSFLALYRGKSLQSAQLVAVSTQSDLVAEVAGELLLEQAARSETEDPALGSVQTGRERALRLIRDEADIRQSD